MAFESSVILSHKFGYIMTHKIAALLILISFFMSGQARSLNETASLILNESPEFQIEKLALETYSLSLKSENNLPDPQLDGEYLFAPSEESNRWATELSWTIEWPGVYRARSKNIRDKLSSTQKNLLLRKLERLAEIKSRLLDYILCSKKIFLLEELSINNDSIYLFAKRASERGELTALDLNKVRLEYANIRAAKALLLIEREDILSDIVSFYGTDCNELLQDLDLSFPSLNLPSAEEIHNLSKESPVLTAALAELKTAKQERKIASMEAFPSLTLGYKHAYEDGMHFNGGLLGISIPIFSANGKQKAAKAAIAEAELKAETTADQLESNLSQSYRKLCLLKSQIEEIEPILNNADHNILLLKAYQGGLLSIIDYLTERNYFTNATMELLSLQHKAAISQVEFQKFLLKEDF